MGSMNTPDVKGAANQVASEAGRHAHKASNNTALIYLARAGFVVSGILHIMIGYIAFKVATGSGGGEASNSGAMAEIASNPGGKILLWLMVAGMAGLAIWRLITIGVASEAKDKAKGAALGVMYLALSFTMSKFARGGSSSDGDKATDFTAKALEMPGGRIAVIVAGVVVVGVGIYGIYKGATQKFKEDIEHGAGSGHVGSAIIIAGTLGYIARGVAFLVLGGLIAFAAIDYDPEKAAGMDAALRTIGEQAFGSILLILTALGFVLYGLYSIARAKYTNEV